MWGAVKDGDGQPRVKKRGGFNREIYSFFGVEPDLVLQHGWFRPKYFTSESWRGELTYDNGGPLPRFFAGEKVFLWNAELQQIEFNLDNFRWKWRDTVIAFRAYDYFNPPQD